jgi:small-conductance mechanosensitive channel
MDQEEANKHIVEPLQKASEELKKLTKKKIKHNGIMGALEETQRDIMSQDSVLKDIEWQYEVRLQQFQYLEREKAELFDSF